MENAYEEKFKYYTVQQLQQIINTPFDYQPQAVEAARLLLGAKSIEVDDAVLIHKEHQLTEFETAVPKNFWDIIIEQTNLFFNKIRNPKDGAMALKWLHIAICIFVALFVYQLYIVLGKLLYIVKQGYSFNKYFILLLLEEVLLPVIFLYLIAIRHKIGWILFSAKVMVSTIRSTVLLYQYYAFRKNPYFPPIPDRTIILQVFFLTGSGAICYLVNTYLVRKWFAIHNNDYGTTFSIVLFIFLVHYFLISYV
jgi:hypothetical protein